MVSYDFGRFVEDHVDRIVREQLAQIEKVCEQSLIDVRRRGVLVERNRYGALLDVYLDESVPYGTIHIITKEVWDGPGTVPAPREGGEGT